MLEAIQSELLPRWVPGQITVDSAGLGWDGLGVRGFRYAPLDVPVPPMRDYMIVAYRRGLTPMSRDCGQGWKTENIGPGQVSMLTHQTDSHWRWPDGIEVTHLYLSPRKMAQVGSDAFDREVTDVQLRDILRADDSHLADMIFSLATEAQEPGVGGRLYADAVMSQICVHILRNYAEVAFCTSGMSAGKLSPLQQRRVVEYIHENLGANLVLADLAKVAGTSVYSLTRRFHASFGLPPHKFVMRERLDQARRLLQREDLPLKVVAAICGFSDQSHMTRLFRRFFGVTPGQCRNPE